jgi:N-acetylmuramoyl-L-alanine amidase
VKKAAAAKKASAVKKATAPKKPADTRKRAAARKTGRARSTGRTRATSRARSSQTEETPFHAGLALPPARPGLPPRTLPPQFLGPAKVVPVLPTTELKRGSRGASVLLLQQVLIELGQLLGPTNGAFGSATEAALRQFQADEGLPVDGLYGPATREALQKALAQAQLPVPLKPSVVPSPSSHRGSRGNVPIDALILHPTATRDPRQETRRRDAPGIGELSAHYLVASDGTLFQLVPDSEMAWHAGLSSLHGQARPSVNSRSIGIEVTHAGSPAPHTEAQYRTLLSLVPYLVRRYAIPPGNVLGRKDVALGNKAVLGDDFDWSRLRRAIPTS